MSTAVNERSRVKTLIDAGCEKAGSAYRLAKLIGYTRNEVSMWTLEKRACPIEAQVLIAAVAGENVDRVLHEALIERNLDTPRGEKLLSALGKGAMTIGGVTVFTALASAASGSNAAELLRCIFRAFL